MTSVCFGGGDGARTRDLRVANAMLFQLSYTPLPSRADWWANVESNHRPPAYQAGALTAELLARLRLAPDGERRNDPVECSRTAAFEFVRTTACAATLDCPTEVGSEVL